jgi:hypothetical protein
MKHGASGLAVMVGVVAAVAAGCGGGTPPPPPAAVAPAAPAAAAPVVRPKEPDTSKALPPIAYEPKGRRDPFTPIFVGKDNVGLSVSSVKLTGVVGGERADGLVEAPDGIGYILSRVTPWAMGASPASRQPRSRSR